MEDPPPPGWFGYFAPRETGPPYGWDGARRPWVGPFLPQWGQAFTGTDRAMQAEHSSLYPPSGGLTCYCLTVDIDVPSGFGGVGSYVQIENWVLGNPCLI